MTFNKGCTRTSVQQDLNVRGESSDIFIHTNNKRAAVRFFFHFSIFFAFSKISYLNPGPSMFLQMRPRQLVWEQPIKVPNPGRIVFSFPFPFFSCFRFFFARGVLRFLQKFARSLFSSSTRYIDLPRFFFIFIFRCWYFQFFFRPLFFLTLDVIWLQFMLPVAAYSDELEVQRQPPPPCFSGTRGAPACATAQSCRFREAFQ